MDEVVPMAPLNIRTERVIVETDRYRIEGDLSLFQGSYHDSLMAYLTNNNDEFIHLTNAEFVSLDGSGRDWTSQSVLLDRRYIRAVAPKDTSKR